MGCSRHPDSDLHHVVVVCHTAHQCTDKEGGCADLALGREGKET